MARRAIHSEDGVRYVDLTPEEKAEAVATKAEYEQDVAIKTANQTRRQAIFDRMEVWDDQLRGRTLPQIVSIFNRADDQAKSDLLLYLLLTRAVELK